MTILEKIYNLSWIIQILSVRKGTNNNKHTLLNTELLKVFKSIHDYMKIYLFVLGPKFKLLLL